MDTGETTREITRALHTVQRQVVIQSAAVHAVRAALWLLPFVIVFMAMDARWQGVGAGPVLLGLVVVAIVGSAVYGALRARRKPIETAVLLDERAGLKSRVSTALSFLASPLDGPRSVQVADAMAYLHAFDWRHHFDFRWPRGSAWVPVLLLVALATFWIPPAGSAVPMETLMDDPLRAAQAAELAAAREALAEQFEEDDPIAEEIQAELEELAKQLEAGEVDEREVMLALSRMENALAERMKQDDLSAMAQEAEAMAPPLQSAETTAAAGEALAQRRPSEAGEALKEAGRSAMQQQMSEQERSEAAEAMKMAAERLRDSGSEDGQPRAGSQSFSHDLDDASEALERGDNAAFDHAMQQMSDKLDRVQQFQNMEAMRQGMSDARSAMAMAEAGQDPAEGGMDSSAEGDDSGEGGTMAGTGTDPDFMGDRQRMDDSVRELMAVRGQLGDGPTQTRIEATEGQLSASAFDVREVLAEYAAAAEEAIERESVPLSHRQHVRRYFEAIRPPAEQPEQAAP